LVFWNVTPYSVTNVFERFAWAWCPSY